MGADVQGVSASGKISFAYGNHQSNNNPWSDLGASYAPTHSSISDISLPPQNNEEEADEQQKDCGKFSGTPMDLELETNAVLQQTFGWPSSSLMGTARVQVNMQVYTWQHGSCRMPLFLM